MLEGKWLVFLPFVFLNSKTQKVLHTHTPTQTKESRIHPRSEPSAEQKPEVYCSIVTSNSINFGLPYLSVMHHGIMWQKKRKMSSFPVKREYKEIFLYDIFSFRVNWFIYHQNEWMKGKESLFLYWLTDLTWLVWDGSGWLRRLPYSTGWMRMHYDPLLFVFHEGYYMSRSYFERRSSGPGGYVFYLSWFPQHTSLHSYKTIIIKCLLVLKCTCRK